MTRRRFTAAFKAKVAIEALKERQSLKELAQKYELHPNQISQWKSEFTDKASTLFATRGKQEEPVHQQEELLKIIGQQKVEIDFLKKNLS
jgi:transposase